MKKIIYLSIFAMAMLLGSACSETQKSEKQMTKAIDPANMDLNIKPGNDFFRYVNGSWMAANPIPPEYSQYGAFHVLYDENQENLKSLVMEVSSDKNAANGSVAQKIRDFYNSGMDTVRIDEAGITAIQDELDAINALQTKADISRQVAEMQKVGINPFFYFYVSADQVNSTMNIVNFYQGGLGLPDVDYYTNPDESSKKLRRQYVEHVTKMFVLAGDSEETAKTKAEKVLEIETALAKTSKTRLERRNPEANFHKVTLADLNELSPEFNWNAYFETFGITDPGEINVGQKDFIAGISPILNEYAVDDWKTYLSWKLIDNSASYLSSDFDQQNFDFFGTTLSGQEQQKERWKRVLSTTSGGLGEAIGQLYVEQYFPPESKEKMVKLVENLRIAFAERIKNLDWMTDATKKEALAKLDAITVKIGYPDKWKDYSVMEVVPDSYIKNVRSANAFEFNRDLAKIGKPVDKTEWGMTPQTVNAYYNPTNNEIVFPAGILQPPFFNHDADDAVNYGAIGVVIGHEMTHGFDDQGRKYDKEGNMVDWWTEEDAKLFEEKTKFLGAQYDKYAMLDSLHVDGALTMGENIADLGGLSISYDAYQMALNGKDAELIDGFTGDQRFYLGYAQVWRGNIRDKELARRLKEDVHSPAEARVNIPVFNIDVFLNAFEISPDDLLYIPAEERAYIW
jgi:putative endopeptidase